MPGGKAEDEGGVRLSSLSAYLCALRDAMFYIGQLNRAVNKQLALQRHYSAKGYSHQQFNLEKILPAVTSGSICNGHRV